MLRTLTLTLAACALFAAADQAKPDRVEAVFKALDADGNGSLSKAEWMPIRTKYATGKFQEQHPKAYAKADSDGNGQLSQDEIASFPHWPGFDRIDADKNGAISRPEWGAVAAELRQAWANRKGQAAPAK